MRSFAAVACVVALACASVALAQSGSVILAPGYIYNYNVANGVSGCKFVQACSAFFVVLAVLLCVTPLGLGLKAFQTRRQRLCVARFVCCLPHSMLNPANSLLAPRPC
jgi:hypothetical protein